jgi:hypothetical protein
MLLLLKQMVFFPDLQMLFLEVGGQLHRRGKKTHLPHEMQINMQA